MAQVKNSENCEVILLNNVFVGDYGKNMDNLPHEVINFYRADNEQAYIYIAPYGTFDSCGIVAILFVRSAGNGFVEIVGKAEGIEKVYVNGLTVTGKSGKQVSVESNADDIKECDEVGIEICVKNLEANWSKGEYDGWKDEINEIKYGGVTLEELHGANNWGIKVYVSCKVEKICLPKATKYICVDESKHANDPRKDSCFLIKVNDPNEKVAKINNQSMKAYYYNKKAEAGAKGIKTRYRKDQYAILSDILNDENLWKQPNDTPCYCSQSILTESNNIFKASRLQDDEVVFSNMLFYFFSKYKEDILLKFIEEVLENGNKDLKGKVKIENNKDSSCIVEREKDRMDICIRGKDYCIILENKIKSGINGIKAKLSEDDDPELCEVDITKKVVVDKSTRKIISQLSKYYEIAKKDYGYDDNKIFCFVLRPEYVGKLNLDDYLNGEQYTQISYEKLHKFFNNVLQEIHKQKKQGKSVFIEDEDICYLNQFCKALHKHTKAVDDEFRTDMLIRMKARIDEINKAKPTSAVQPVLPNNN